MEMTKQQQTDFTAVEHVDLLNGREELKTRMDRILIKPLHTVTLDRWIQDHIKGKRFHPILEKVAQGILSERDARLRNEGHPIPSAAA